MAETPRSTEAEKEQAAVQARVTPGDAPERSPGEKAAEEAELKRQETVAKAVDKANEHELPKLGGPSLEPGAPDR